jgi:dTDP-4-amino-4,6-dideoxygalactose transaminase
MNHIKEFENLIADYFGSKYAIATDSCTHAIELCLRHTGYNNLSCPKNTYLSVPMTFIKLNLSWNFNNEEWQDFYHIKGSNIIDAAVLWKENSYINDTFMCISFQFKKHLNLGRGGIILTDNKKSAETLKKMSYDGRLPDIPWAEQNIEMLGYHYYMTPEVAEQGILKFNLVKDQEPKQWSYKNYPNLENMKIFKNV